MNCRTCSCALFDECWGDYKCSVTKHSVDPDEIKDCKTYKKGEPKIAKGITDEV